MLFLLKKGVIMRHRWNFKIDKQSLFFVDKGAKVVTNKKNKDVPAKTAEQRRILGKKIRDLRTLHGMTQEDLAAALEYSKNFISDVERGIKGMKKEKILEAAKIFNVPPDELISTEEREDWQLEMLRDFYTAIKRPNNPHMESLKSFLKVAAKNDTTK